ncbi:Non-motile and phage-resistance protein [Delftia tsuruhatensis]|uniref:CHASE2 and HATPase_c domain-containing protein n=1 Tax=Delftia tsuruhatensis TaxID=180282 RepID=UPI001E71AC51|nr:CHASE2 and HATPase_c domain-containing protein [Delftia tsuruhatensis]CAB5668024.1 Non-motile and phage-resistance protein [Delftia tsuruhatensis]CAC9678114.1 Non-motile and phage-resistance protein [Delftia tsuruhatensis]
MSNLPPTPEPGPEAPAQQAPARGRGLRRDWLLLAAGLLSLVLWLSGDGQLERANGFVQDTASWLHQPRASRDIVIIAIDEASIDAIGRWPWRRALHAGLLERIGQAPPRAIGLDVILSEEDLDYPGDDLLLARTLQRSGRTVLPVAAGTAPLPAFAQAAAALGHTQLPVDTDGAVRSFHAVEGTAQQPWWHMALSLHCIGESGRACTSPKPAPQTQPGAPAWQRHQREIIAFARPGSEQGARDRSPFTTYSYIDVLRGRIPAAAFRGKYVLIGTTAEGLGTRFTAPLGAGARPISSVEMLAHVLNGSLQGTHVHPASVTLDRGLNAGAVLLALLALAWLGPSGGMLACAMLALACLSLAGLAPRIWQVQTAPAAGLLGLALAYPLWGWLRLRAAARFLALELRDLQGQGLPMSLGGDLLDQRIAAVEQASRQLRALHHFVSESLRQLPSATFVCDRQGHLLLANSAAHAYARSLGRELRAGDALPPLLAGLKAPEATGQAGSALLTATALAAGALPRSSEGQDAQGRSLMLLAQAFDAQPTTGWLITLVDISELRSAQAQRDQAMQFISHDIRAPVASIITLLEMQRGSATPLSSQALLPRIEGYAQASLQLADDFVHLARARQQVIRQEPLDLGLVVDQAVESCWAQATAAQVCLQFSLPQHEYPVLGDQGMLHRAIVNLIGNAIKYGHGGHIGAETTVQCLLSQDAAHCRIAIRDHGPGMDAETLARLSRPFERLEQHKHVDGVGLGLAFARTVAARHGGRLDIQSAPAEGSTFSIVLPKATASAPD